MDGEKRKAVCFNLSHATERGLYEFASSINFGRFVKLKLAEELAKRNIQRNTITVNMFADK